MKHILVGATTAVNRGSRAAPTRLAAGMLRSTSMRVACADDVVGGNTRKERIRGTWFTGYGMESERPEPGKQQGRHGAGQ